MVAGIFAAHGVWVGEHAAKELPKTPEPYPSFENREIDNAAHAVIRSKRPQSYLFETIDRLNPSEPWLYKCNPEKARLLRALIPNSIVVRVFRYFPNVLASSDESTRPGRWNQFNILQGMRGPSVHTDELIDGNYSSLAAAFNQCGLTLDRELTAQQIRPELWHHKRPQ